MKLNRILVLAAVSAVAVSAHAFTIDVVSIGVAPNTLPNINFTENVVFQTASIAVPVFTTNNWYAVNIVPPVSGAGLFDDGAGNSLAYNLTIDSASTNQGMVSGSGTWDYTGGTGAYAGLAGGGTFGFSIQTTTDASYSTWVGQLNAVPEPTSMGLLGLGALALVRRRRK